MIGNIWSIAQESGSDWNSEKLQKYLSASSLDNPRNSSGACFKPAAIWLISRVIDQYRRSICARVFRSTIPWLNKSNASSLICCASCHASNILFWFSESQIPYNSCTNSCASGAISSSSSHSGKVAVSRTSKMRTEWCAVNARPLSVMIFGCGMPFLSLTSTSVEIESFTYSWME